MKCAQIVLLFTALVIEMGCKSYETERLRVLSTENYHEPVLPEKYLKQNVIDEYKELILRTVKMRGGADSKITISDSTLRCLDRIDRKYLIRYLSTNPAWRVFQDHGSWFATRRMKIKSNWEYSLHGYYSKFDFEKWPGLTIPEFQTKVTIGLDGKPWATDELGVTSISRGQTKEIQFDKVHTRIFPSQLKLDLDRYTVEIFEETESKERIISKAAIQYLSNEISRLENVQKIESMNKTFSVSDSDSTIFEIFGHNGIYNSLIGVNPGESGFIYLKAVDLTDSSQLSASQLKTYTNERVGWSDNPKELFYSNTTFTIYEGGFDTFYVARFEIWFVPDSGKPERKLTEKKYKINGWER